MKTKFVSKFLTALMALFLASSMAIAQGGAGTAKAKSTAKSSKSDSAMSSTDKSPKSGDKAMSGMSSDKTQIDINTASKDELVKALPGVGDVTADKIIAGRPYSNKRQLVSKKIVTEKVYTKISDQIIAKQDSSAAAASGSSTAKSKSDTSGAGASGSMGSDQTASKGKKKKKGAQ